jgi:hypothetical protein
MSKSGSSGKGSHITPSLKIRAKVNKIVHEEVVRPIKKPF